MLLTIVAIWAIVLPLAILAVSWQTARLREARASQTARPLGPAPTSHAGSLPACAAPRRAAAPDRHASRLPGVPARRGAPLGLGLTRAYRR